jgi:16S rRNA (cytosine967-C5)-methyltransferase
VPTPAPVTGPATARSNAWGTALATAPATVLADRRASKPAPGARRNDGSAGSASRRVAIDALLRIERGGAYANLVLPELLERSHLEPADRHFVTELVYGTTRMQRACDHLVDRFLLDQVEPEVRAALRLGAYQLVFLATPPHAALDATVGAVRGRGRSVVNAVLRRVAAAGTDAVTYPDLATELSYPDWIVERLTADLGADVALAALRAMNTGSTASARADGYIQDEASQLVAPAVGAQPGQLVVDLCAAPGGKATGLASAGARVVAADIRPGRVGLVVANARRLGLPVPALVADGTRPPIRPGVVDHVLVDAPCSGLGSLRRRADARWRIEPDAPARLARLQVELVLAGLSLLRPGGTLTYSVCTLTRAEGPDVVAEVLRRADGGAEALEPPGEPWQAVAGSGDGARSGPTAILLPIDNDGMTLARLAKR